MAIKDSAATGNWTTGATWSGGSPPGATDFGRINTGHTVTYDPSATSCMGYIINGGLLVFAKDFLVSDFDGAGITIKNVNSGGITSGASKSSVRSTYNENYDANTYPCSVSVEAIEGKDSRALDYDFCKHIGFKSYLGNSDYYIEFNTKLLNKPILNQVSPPLSDVQLIEHGIKRRPLGGRVYPDSITARYMVLEGYAHVDNFIHDQLKRVLATNKRIAVVSPRATLMKCWIDRQRVGPPRVGFQSFSIVVKEDTN